MREIKFISYDGEKPNLCSGKLTLQVDGVFVVFPFFCLVSGGSYGIDSNGDSFCTEGPWQVIKWPEGFMDEDKKNVIDIVNANIPYGCCGGCI